MCAVGADRLLTIKGKAGCPVAKQQVRKAGGRQLKHSVRGLHAGCHAIICKSQCNHHRIRASEGVAGDHFIDG